MIGCAEPRTMGNNVQTALENCPPETRSRAQYYCRKVSDVFQE